MVGRMILAKTFLLSQIVFPAQVVQIHRKEIKKIEKLIYAFVNGARNLYGPERIARTVLKAPKEQGGINGVDVDAFLKSIAIRQYSKAFSKSRILGELQLAQGADEIGKVARPVLRQNFRKYAGDFAMPDLRQLELISAIPVAAVLSSNTNASNAASRESIGTLGDLQQMFSNRLMARTRVASILKSLPCQLN